MASLTMAAALAAFAAGAPGAHADPIIVPSAGPLSFVDAFFGGAYFGGGGGDGRNGFPWSSAPATAIVAATPALGCYFTRTRVDNAWKRVEVCY